MLLLQQSGLWKEHSIDSALKYTRAFSGIVNLAADDPQKGSDETEAWTKSLEDRELEIAAGLTQQITLKVKSLLVVI